MDTVTFELKEYEHDICGSSLWQTKSGRMYFRLGKIKAGKRFGHTGCYDKNAGTLFFWCQDAQTWLEFLAGIKDIGAYQRQDFYIVFRRQEITCYLRENNDSPPISEGNVSLSAISSSEPNQENNIDFPTLGESAIDRKEYYASDDWKKKASSAKKRVNNKCQVCNSGKNGLIAHHRTYENLGSEKPEDITVLCTRCHKLFHAVCEIATVITA
jgi:hypothetical protein